MRCEGGLLFGYARLAMVEAVLWRPHGSWSVVVPAVLERSRLRTWRLLVEVQVRVVDESYLCRQVGTCDQISQYRRRLDCTPSTYLSARMRSYLQAPK